MSTMISLLLQPASKPTESAAVDKRAGNAAQSGPSFSSVYAQQQRTHEAARLAQQREAKASAPERRPDQPPTSASATTHTPVKRDEAPRTQDNKKPEEKKEMAVKRQENDDIDEDAQALSTDEASEFEAIEPDPLLLQVMLANRFDAEAVEAGAGDAAALQQVIEEGSLTALPLYSSFSFNQLQHSTDADEGEGDGVSLDLDAAMDESALLEDAAESAGEPLEELGEFGEELTMVKADMARLPTAGQAGTTVETKTTFEPVGRAESLMRSESVQAAAGARTVPGQPLAMQQPGWSQELTDKVMWMSAKNLKSAEIQLNPAELGRLDIRVQVNQETTQITFTSMHAGVRDSLEGQVQRLREMLEQQGMHDVDVNVADQSPQEQRHAGAAQGTGAGVAQGAEDDAEVIGVSEVEQPQEGHLGLVSYYV